MPEARKVKVKLCNIGLSNDAIYLYICDQSPAGSDESYEKKRMKNSLLGANGWEEDNNAQLLDAYRVKSTEPIRSYALRVEGTNLSALSGGEFERMLERDKRTIRSMLQKTNFGIASFNTKFGGPSEYELRPNNGAIECEISLDKIDGKYEILCRGVGASEESRI